MVWAVLRRGTLAGSLTLAAWGKKPPAILVQPAEPVLAGSVPRLRSAYIVVFRTFTSVSTLGSELSRSQAGLSSFAHADKHWSSRASYEHPLVLPQLPQR
jgi:hypothetical protein